MSRLAALLLVARAGARRGAGTSAAALHPDLYFRQVRAGDQIALDASELSAFARQMNNFMYLVGDRRTCLLYTSPSPRDGLLSRMPSSA